MNNIKQVMFTNSKSSNKDVREQFAKIATDGNSCKVFNFDDIIRKPEKKTINEMHDYLITQLTLKNADMELEVYKARQERRTNKLQRYFNSGDKRYYFARLMVKAKGTDRFYTIKDIVNSLYTNRQTVVTIIKETHAEGWIDIVKHKNRTMCRASDVLWEAHREYSIWRKALSQKLTVPSMLKLVQFEDLMSNELTED
tara:strand:- start:5724 stop:6317 length:594 start_codon:yes stop_codon:yes gene_type:complete